MIGVPSAHVGGIPVEETLGSFGPAILVGLGIRRLEAGARLPADRAFDRALMVSILVTDTSLFYLSQFSTSYRLAIDLLLLVTVRYMARRERALERAATQDRDLGASATAPAAGRGAEPAPEPAP